MHKHSNVINAKKSFVANAAWQNIPMMTAKTTILSSSNNGNAVQNAIFLEYLMTNAPTSLAKSVNKHALFVLLDGAINTIITAKKYQNPLQPKFGLGNLKST